MVIKCYKPRKKSGQARIISDKNHSREMMINDTIYIHAFENAPQLRETVYVFKT
jgi:hypothetical protein